MHEVEAFVLDAREELAALGRRDGVPAHVRDDGAGSSSTVPGHSPSPGAHAVLDALFEEDLVADADAQHRAAAGDAAADPADGADVVELLP